MIGFVVSAAVTFVQARLDREHLTLLPFFMILFGLIVGHMFARAFRKVARPRLRVLVGHAKALAVLAAAGFVMLLCLTGQWRRAGEVPLTVACSLISFYYGARS